MSPPYCAVARCPAGLSQPRRPNHSLARMMIGRDLPHTERPRADVDENEGLTVNGLSYEPNGAFSTPLSDVSLTVHGGEIVGIAGVSGNGQNTLASLLSGELRLPAAQQASIQVDGTASGGRRPGRAARHGSAFHPRGASRARRGADFTILATTVS